MDLSLPLIGVLGLIGYNINKKPNSREYTDTRIKIPTAELQNGKTIYESKDYVRNTKNEQTMLDTFYKDENTIISTNKYTTRSNTTALGGANTVGKLPRDSVGGMIDVNKGDRIHAGPMFKEGAYFSTEISPKEINEKFDGNVSELSGIKTDFTHTNMQPFFGSNVKQSIDGVSMLDKYTGRNFANKMEVELEKPQNKQEINGMKPYTQMVDTSRFTVGRTMNNVLPFKQYREPPIPQEYIRGSEKNVDELRPLNKPKAGGLEARINPGSGNYQRPVEQDFVKNRVSTTYAGDFSGIYPTFNKNTEQTYTSRQQDDIRMTTKNDLETEFNTYNRYSARGDTKLISTNEEDKTASYYAGSKHYELPNDWVRNATVSVPIRDENIQNTYTAYEQERETTNRELIGNAFEAKGDVMRSLDKAKTTNKELSNYSYIPTPGAVIEKAPMGREFYNEIEFKTRPTQEHFAGGVKKYAPQATMPITSQRQRQGTKDYNGPIKMNNIQLPDMRNIGENTTNKKYKQMETDFTYRLT